MANPVASRVVSHMLSGVQITFFVQAPKITKTSAVTINTIEHFFVGDGAVEEQQCYMDGAQK